MKMVVAVMILLLVAQTTSPQIPHSVPPGTDDSPAFHSGNDLFRICQSKEEKSYCLAYIIGIVDMIGMLEGSVDKDRKEYWKFRAVCLPNGAEAGQVRDVVVKFLVDHPERRDERAAQLVVVTLIDTWGCPRAPAS